MNHVVGYLAVTLEKLASAKPDELQAFRWDYTEGNRMQVLLVEGQNTPGRTELLQRPIVASECEDPPTGVCRISQSR